jgi:hypothetical protein
VLDPTDFLFPELAQRHARRGMSQHERAKDGGTEQWLTPPALLSKLGEFDLDPCSPVNRPWPTAKHHYTMYDNGLTKTWEGRVWLNPPYGAEAVRWMRRMKEHGNGIALIPARTETRMFFECVWPHASAILFVKGRIRFFTVEGRPASGAGPAPMVLISYGANNAATLFESGIEGQCLRNKFNTDERKLSSE